MEIPDKLPRSCRYCAEMVCGDVNYCEAKHIVVRDSALSKVRNCGHWIGNTMAADTYEEWEPKPEPKPQHCEGQLRLELLDDD